MLAVASEKVPSARLLQGDIGDFWLDERFDVVICVFDTVNHLLSFEAWRSMFDAVYDHLVDDGLFIFDVNTVGELRRLGEEPPWVFDFDDHVLIMDVTPGDGGLSEWDIRIFEHRGGRRFESASRGDRRAGREPVPDQVGTRGEVHPARGGQRQR